MKNYLSLILFLCTLGSCTKSVRIIPPVNLQTTQAVFATRDGAFAALSGIYSQMMTSPSFASSALTIYPGLSADELQNSRTNLNYDEFYANDLQPSVATDLDNQFWRPAYALIYQANSIIEALGMIKDLSSQDSGQLAGEAKFVRAFCYFYLTNLFGDVPLVTTTDYQTNGILPRTPRALVEAQMVLDLAQARELLTISYPSEGRVRPNKWAATALEIRLALYQRRWADAEAGATKILTSGMYQLAPDLNQVFLAGSQEAILQLQPVITDYGNNTLEGLLFVPYSSASLPTFIIQNALLGAFEPGDHRKSEWIGLNKAGGQNYYFPYKYKISDNAPSAPLEYSMVLRLAEIYLIRAEARAHGDNVIGSQADLNAIRTRAGLSGTNASDRESLLKAIEQERRVELCFEWGHRWFDLKRTARLDTVLGPIKTGWQSYDSLYPIPKVEILTNPFLLQNRGY